MMAEQTECWGSAWSAPLGMERAKERVRGEWQRGQVRVGAAATSAFQDEDESLNVHR